MNSLYLSPHGTLNDWNVSLATRELNCSRRVKSRKSDWLSLMTPSNGKTTFHVPCVDELRKKLLRGAMRAFEFTDKFCVLYNI